MSPVKYDSPPYVAVEELKKAGGRARRGEVGEEGGRRQGGGESPGVSFDTLSSKIEIFATYNDSHNSPTTPFTPVEGIRGIMFRPSYNERRLGSSSTLICRF